MTSITKQIIKKLVKLEPEEFIGVCKILGVNLIKEDIMTDDGNGSAPSNFNSDIITKSGKEVIVEVIEKIEKLNRTQKRNLFRLLKSATKGR